MLVSPNIRLFDRVPDLFTSPYPGADAYANDAFLMLLERATGEGSQTVGQALLTRAGAQAWNHATQMIWKIKATEVGDILARQDNRRYLWRSCRSTVSTDDGSR
jgi:hypothetical protein